MLIPSLTDDNNEIVVIFGEIKVKIINEETALFLAVCEL